MIVINLTKPKVSRSLDPCGDTLTLLRTGVIDPPPVFRNFFIECLTDHADDTIFTRTARAHCTAATTLMFISKLGMGMHHHIPREYEILLDGPPTEFTAILERAFKNCSRVFSFKITYVEEKV